VPLAEWLRNEIRTLANSAFYNEEAGLAHFFDMEVVRAVWQRHLQGENHHSQELWSMLNFELWWQAYGEGGKDMT
jgi:asparagine synthase (glutamine-hydrolysing)